MVSPDTLTVADHLARWLTDHAKTAVSAKTFERYTDLAQKHVARHLGAHKLQKLAPLHIQGMYMAMLTSGRLGRAFRTVHHAHRLLFSALRQAVRWQLLARNPAEAVKPPSVAGREIGVLDDAQIGQLLNAAKSTRLYVPIMVAVTTGLRRGEVLALRWEDVDFARGRVTVAQAMEQTKADGVDGSRSRHQSAKVWKQSSNHELREPPAMGIATVGLDLAKNVFQVHAINGAGEVVVRKKLRRAQVLRFFERLDPCLVGIEACGTSHYWAREISKCGHEVRLMPPAYVKILWGGG